MARYDGLIIPRAWNEYINKSDPVAMSQALQLFGVMDAAPTASSNKPVKSGGVYTVLQNYEKITTLPDNTDLNTVLTPGKYYIQGGNTNTHAPAIIETAGYCLEVSRAGFSVYTQELSCVVGNIKFIRFYYSAWSEWICITNTDITETDCDKVIPREDKMGYCIAPNCTQNLPTNTSAMAAVLALLSMYNGVYYIVQIASTYSSSAANHHLYKRQGNGSSKENIAFGEWVIII